MKLKKYLFMFLFLGITILALSTITHDAQARNCYWVSSTPQNSGTAAAWNGGIAPGANDNLFYSLNYTGRCLINTPTTFGNITLGISSGTVMQGSVNFRYTNIVLNGGIWYGNQTHPQTCNGNFSDISGTIFGDVLNLVVSHDNSIINIENSNIWRLEIAANVTLTSRDSGFNVEHAIQIDTGKTLYSIIHKNISFSAYTGTSYINNGVIGGIGNFQITTYNSNQTLNLGKVTGKMTLYGFEISSAPRTIFLNASSSLGPQLSIISASTYPLTLDLKGYSISLSGLLNITTNGILLSSLPGASISSQSINTINGGVLNGNNIKTISLSNNWDTSAGSFISGIGSVITNGSGTTKLAANQGFYNLDSTSSAIRTMLSNVWIKNHLGINGTINEGVFYKNISSNIAIPLDLYSGSFSSIYMNGTSSAYQVNFIGPMTGYVYSKASVTYHGPAGNIVTYSVGSSYIGTEVHLQTFPTKYQYSISYPTGVQLMLFQVSGLKSVTIYNVSVNGVNLTQIQSNFTGIGSYTLAGPWSFVGSAVVLNQVIPAVTPIPPVVKGQDYTGMAMALLFLGLVTLFNFYGHKEKMLAIQLIAIVIMLPGVVWAFLIMPGTWEIPLLFIMVNLVIFVMDAARGRN